MWSRENIEKAKQGFEKSFAEKNFYDKQTKDDKHLQSILNSLKIKDGDKILDFGTGSGYLAFAIAKKHPKCSVTGLDIVSKTLEQNKVSVLEQEIHNLDFTDYNGTDLPFKDSTFDCIVTRYVLHHVPDIQYTFNEISRVLKPGGCFFLSDPTPNELDTCRFVDSYMQLQNDGHIKFYTLNEFSDCAANSGMDEESSFLTTIRFPRKINEKYVKLINKTDDIIKQVYKIETIGDECFIVEDVLNITFRKWEVIYD